MKLINHFNDFLADTVNLNATRIKNLEDNIEAIKNFIRGSTWAPRRRGFAAQGSWAHKTIIKPVDGAPFDADLLVYIDAVDGWEARDYLNTLYDIFKASGTYSDKVRRWSHCVTIEYTGERKIDIAPCIVDRNRLVGFEVCNRDTNAFERSEPKKYTDWLISCNSITSGNNFRKVSRLLKYLRDIKTTFTCPSILLTTLLGYRITASDKDDSGFTDIPTALKTIIGRLDDWLQSNPVKPTVKNPFLYSEVFSNAWDEAKYNNFRDKIHTYRSWIDDAYNEIDRDESIGKWRRVFGEEFAKLIALDEAATVSSKALTVAKSAMLASSSLAADLVSLVGRFGQRALPPGFNRLPHMHRPKWREIPQPLFGVSVSASLYSSRKGSSLGSASSLSPVPTGRWLKFQAFTQAGNPLPDTYEIQWRVTNTDEAASRANALRGEFYSSNDGNARWESLSYRGVHLVEAFVIRKRDSALVSKSAPFYVTIE